MRDQPQHLMGVAFPSASGSTDRRSLVFPSYATFSNMVESKNPVRAAARRKAHAKASAVASSLKVQPAKWPALLEKILWAE